jgi:imidazolonepropionase-like amidohydrolase
MSTVLRAASLIDGTGCQPLSNPVIVVEGGRITSILSGKDTNGPTGPDVRTLDFPGKTILPGMVDGHVHLVFDPALKDRERIRARVLEESKIELALRALRNAQSALRAGVTTLRDCGDREFVTLEVRDAIASGLAVGPRLLVSGPPITTTGGHLHYMGYQADSPDEMRRAARTLIREGVDFLKIMATGGMMTRGTNPSTAQYTVEEIKAAVDEAHRVGRRVVAHAHGTPGIRNAVQAGVDTIAHCKWQPEVSGRDYEPRLRKELSQGAHWWKPAARDQPLAVIKEMIERGINVDLTFSGVRRALIPHEGIHAEKQEACRAQLRDLHYHYRVVKEAGVKVSISSDAGPGGTTFEDFALSPVGVVEAGVMTPMEAIVAVTRLPAEAIGLEDDVGTVEPGKCADLIVVDGNPLENLRNLGRVAFVMLAGQAVVSGGTMISAR